MSDRTVDRSVFDDEPSPYHIREEHIRNAHRPLLPLCPLWPRRLMMRNRSRGCKPSGVTEHDRVARRMGQDPYDPVKHPAISSCVLCRMSTLAPSASSRRAGVPVLHGPILHGNSWPGAYPPLCPGASISRMSTNEPVGYSSSRGKASSSRSAACDVVCILSVPAALRIRPTAG